MSSEQAKALVQKMVEAGEWPEPALLDEILAQGQEIVEPLLEVLRSRPRGWPAEAPLHYASVLLCILRPPQAVPALVELLRDYGDDTSENVARNAAVFGAEIIEPALAVARDAGLIWYSRSAAAELAIRAAGDTADLRSRVAAGLREILAQQIAKAPQYTTPAGEEDDEDDDEDDIEFIEGAMDEVEDDFEPEDDETESLEDSSDEGDDEDGGETEDPSAEAADDYYQMTSCLVADLSLMADPEARGLIAQAFEANAVDPWTISKEDVAHDYRRGRQALSKADPRAALRRYRRDYEDRRAEARRQPLSLQQAPAPLPPVADDEYEEPSLQPFINYDKKPGRNEPCWCGSGKKYKNCHMRQDRQ